MNVKLFIVATTALAATTLSAQTPFQVGSATNVTIGGLFTAGIKNSEVTNSARPGVSQEWRIDDNTSRLIISSNSKIADGWSVIFRVESRFTVDVRPSSLLAPAYATTAPYTTTGTATGWADGDTWGGVSTPIGAFVYGKSTLYWGDGIAYDYLGTPGVGETYRIWDANGLGIFNILDQANYVSGKTGAATGSAYTLGITREQNVLRYDSVKFHDFDLALAYSKNDGGDENHYVAPGTAGYARGYEDGGTFYARVRYDHGGWHALASVFNKALQGGTYNPAASMGPLDSHGQRAGVSYIFPFGLKAGIVVDKTLYNYGILGTANDAKRTAYTVPISYNWGDHGVYFTYGKAGTTSGYDGTGATQINVVYDYALTKRAFIGILYAKINNDANAHYSPFLSGTSLGPSGIGANGEGYRVIGLNMNYWF